MAAGVISLTGGRTIKGTPDSLGTCGPGVVPSESSGIQEMGGVHEGATPLSFALFSGVPLLLAAGR